MAAPRKADIVAQLELAGIAPPTGLVYSDMSVASLRAHALSNGVTITGTPTTGSTTFRTSRTVVTDPAPTPRRIGPLEYFRPRMGGLFFWLRWLAVGLGILVLIFLLALFLKKNWDPFSDWVGDQWDSSSNQTTQVVPATATSTTSVAVIPDCVISGINLGNKLSPEECQKLLATAAQVIPGSTITPVPQTDGAITPTAQAADTSYTYQWVSGDLRREPNTCYMMVSKPGETVVIDDSRAGWYSTGVFNAGSKEAYDKAVQKVQNAAIDDPNNASGACKIIDSQ